MVIYNVSAIKIILFKTRSMLVTFFENVFSSSRLRTIELQLQNANVKNERKGKDSD